MSFNLMKVFKSNELEKIRQTAGNIVQLALKTNKKTGAKIARAVFDNGAILIKTVTSTGVTIGEAIDLPAITSKVQRDRVILDLAKQKYTQEEIAMMLDISQSTVSKELKK